jgi:TfoX/Sxy family transcriptional regulator of competence genes
MASSQETVDYITEQMAAAGNVRSRKMFGEYAIYCDDKVVALVCDDRLFMKDTEPGRALVRNQEFSKPYPGAKDSLVVSEDDWDDAEYLSHLARATTDALPSPKKK